MSAPGTLSTPAPAVAAPADAELIERTLAGEREAFSELVRRHQQSLYGYARHMGVAHDPALDLVQEALVRAFVRLRQCRERHRFRAWLFRIFRNLVIDYGRDVRRREIPLEAVENTAAPEATSALNERSVLARALRQLPELLREAFLLRHESDYSYEEIAEITGSGVSAVKMRVHRAREQLRAALAEERM